MKLIIGNPYDWNYIVKKNKEKKVEITPTASQVVMDTTCNLVGKFLGIESKPDWNKYYDKVYEIVEWAKERIGSEDVNNLISILKEKLNASPSISDRRINDLYVAIKLEKGMREVDYNGNVKNKEVKEL